MPPAAAKSESAGVAGSRPGPAGTAGPAVFAPATLGPLTLRNRVIKAATFEGVTRRQVVSDELIEFHRRVSAGGVGMSTVAYCAVSPEGSTDGRTIVLRPEAVAGLRQLTDAIHEHGALGLSPARPRRTGGQPHGHQAPRSRPHSDLQSSGDAPHQGR